MTQASFELRTQPSKNTSFELGTEELIMTQVSLELRTQPSKNSSFEVRVGAK